MSTFYSENYKIKKVLDDIVAQAYPANELLSKYKSFYLMLNDKNIKSYAGQYKHNEHVIEIVGLDRDSKHIVITCIHELSHHIDYINRGTTDHGKDFYSIYRALLYTALNMRIITPEDISMTDTTDANKVRTIVREWRPSYVDYKSNMVIIKVSNCFDQKDLIKERGYKYNAAGHTWNYELNQEDVNEEKEYLYSIGITDEKFLITNASDLNINVKLKIFVKGNTYDFKDYLKENKFRWKDKQWVRYVEDGENVQSLIDKYQKKMPDCKFTYKA